MHHMHCCTWNIGVQQDLLPKDYMHHMHCCTWNLCAASTDSDQETNSGIALRLIWKKETDLSIRFTAWGGLDSMKTPQNPTFKFHASFPKIMKGLWMTMVLFWCRHLAKLRIVWGICLYDTLTLASLLHTIKLMHVFMVAGWWVTGDFDC